MHSIAVISCFYMHVSYASRIHDEDKTETGIASDVETNLLIKHHTMKTYRGLKV
jgi:hypothetical protein